MAVILISHSIIPLLKKVIWKEGQHVQWIWEYVVLVAAAKIVGRAVRVPARSLWLPLFSSPREGFSVLVRISPQTPHDIAERFIKLNTTYHSLESCKSKEFDL